MKKVTFNTHSIEYDLSEKQLIKAIETYLYDEKNQIPGDNTTIYPIDNGGIRLITIYGRKADKIEEL